MRFFNAEKQSLENFHVHNFNKYVDDSVEQTQSNSKKFEDSDISLCCYGDCGSNVNKLLISKTNLEIYETFGKPPRIVDIACGKAPGVFYQKLSFDEDYGYKPRKNEEEFYRMFIQHIKDTTKSSMDVTFSKLESHLQGQF